MAWTERTDLRNRSSRTYEDAGQFQWDGIIADLHYESVLDSGSFDTEINAAPVRVNVPAFDGWRVTASGWHYALGKDLANHGSEDGWIGFGGRAGAHWFKYRLERAGYLHWPTRAWDDVGGAPTYDRANLTQAVNTTQIGPNNDEINVSTTASWVDLWTTPGGGALDVRWIADGRRLKEEIVVNQAARDWITANHPPATPLAETWFGFVFRLDWSDVPRVYRDAVLQDIDEDFADDGQAIDLRDALDRLLALLPLSDVVIRHEDGTETRESLRKRLWLDGDGNHYLLVGLRCDTLNGMPVGDLVFDPTVEYQIGASSDDAEENISTGACNITRTTHNFGSYAATVYIGLRFLAVTIPVGATIDTAYLILKAADNDSGPFDSDFWGEDGSTPGTFTTDNSNISGRTPTTATVAWDSPASWTSGTWYNSPEIKTIVQELVDSYDYSSGLAMAIINKYDSGSGERLAASYDSSASDAPKLHIEYTAVGGALPMAMHYYRRRRSG
jgi:hypothetical protein